MFHWERRSVAIDFRLTASQRELQLRSRKFAKEVLSPAIEAETLPTPEERFAATKPAYEAMIAAGFLRKCIPRSAAGENDGLIDTAILVEELYAVSASVTLTLIGTVLGLLPLLVGGTKEQRHRLLPPFLKLAGAPLAGFCATEPGGSANAASPPPGEGVRTTARFSGDRWIIQVARAGFPRPRVGIARARTFCRCSAAPILMLLPNGVFRSYSWSVLHQAWSSNGRSIRWGTARTSCRNSDSKALASQAVISSGVSAVVSP
jgi:hypothetical protein